LSTWAQEKFYLLATDSSGAWDALQKFCDCSQIPLDQFSDVTVRPCDRHWQVALLIDYDGANDDGQIERGFRWFQKQCPEYGIARYHYAPTDEATILGLQPLWVMDETGTAMQWYLQNVQNANAAANESEAQ
jgi:hypothetical protein